MSHGESRIDAVYDTTRQERIKKSWVMGAAEQFQVGSAPRLIHY